MKRWTEPDKLILIRNWALWGATEAQVAKKMGISTRTFRSWCKKEKRIENAFKNSKELADSVVENTLYKKASEGDTQSIKFWLENRNPERWKKGGNKDKEVARSLELDNEMKELKLKELKTKQESNRVHFTGIPADFIAPPFIQLHHDIQNKKYLEYCLPGGRGSAKSSTIALEIVNLIERNPDAHAVVCRMVGETLRNSVYNQVGWAIEKLGLIDEYRATTAPLEYIKKSTGQHIYFRGADDPIKLKSIAVPFGNIKILWYEELDQFKGDEKVRNIQQSVIRGSNDAWVFKSFNPPRSKNNWANEYIDTPKDNRSVVWSNFTQVPQDWLGRHFLDEAEWLKKNKPDAYENEYLGVINGNGGNVFENVVPVEFDDDEIKSFDNVSNGLDWGFYPDPFAFVRVHYDSTRRILKIYDEIVCHKKSNLETAEMVKEHLDFSDEQIVCDSAEPKSINDYIMYGLNAGGAVKGNGSVEYGIKWLQGLLRIEIDRKRCPKAYKEFIAYEYDRDADGNLITAYPDKDNHTIDAVRYATERYSKKAPMIKV